MFGTGFLARTWWPNASSATDCDRFDLAPVRNPWSEVRQYQTRWIKGAPHGTEHQGPLRRHGYGRHRETGRRAVRAAVGNRRAPAVVTGVSRTNLPAPAPGRLGRQRAWPLGWLPAGTP